MKILISIIQNRSEFIFRVLLSLIFVVSGIIHMLLPAQVTDKLLTAELGAKLASYMPAHPLTVLGGVGLFFGGVALLLGYKTQWASILLLCLVIPITIIVQMQGLHTIGPLFKNIGLIGGLIYFAANGSISPALDNRTRVNFNN